MKKVFGFLLIATLLLTVSTTLSSCNRKTGCPSTENVKPKLKKNGMPKKKSKSSLFPKSMTKSKRKNK